MSLFAIRAARLGLLTLALLGAAKGSAGADPVAASVDVPIFQTKNRDGALRYAIWVTVGDRTVQALLDTGSTGLRVLPAVVPGAIQGRAVSVTFGAAIVLRGKNTFKLIGIGQRQGAAPIQVAEDVTCTEEQPECPVAASHGDDFLIGGDGAPHEGYSAIIGIGLPFRGTDIGNPLQTLGVKRWIVQLPRPDEDANGHLILDPSDDIVASFTKLARHGSADADGCIEGGPLIEKKCGTLLFDTGAPQMHVAFAEAKSTITWASHATGHLSFKTTTDTSLELPFTARQNGGLLAIKSIPASPVDPLGVFILAGVAPFFRYDVLYDADAHSVALRARAPRPVVARETNEPDEDAFFQTGSIVPRGDETGASRDGIAFH